MSGAASAPARGCRARATRRFRRASRRPWPPGAWRLRRADDVSIVGTTSVRVLDRGEVDEHHVVRSPPCDLERETGLACPSGPVSVEPSVRPLEERRHRRELELAADERRRGAGQAVDAARRSRARNVQAQVLPEDALLECAELGRRLEAEARPAPSPASR